MSLSGFTSVDWLGFGLQATGTVCLIALLRTCQSSPLCITGWRALLLLLKCLQRTSTKCVLSHFLLLKHFLPEVHKSSLFLLKWDGGISSVILYNFKHCVLQGLYARLLCIGLIVGPVGFCYNICVRAFCLARHAIARCFSSQPRGIVGDYVLSLYWRGP